MELPDVNVKVLYDFEYTTKDGREVKIKESEKLYLIKKTNEDWWQVIRNTGRPFYVPASYVQEVQKPGDNIEKMQEKFQNNCTVDPRMRIQSDPVYRNRSCSVESQKTHENHRHKPAVPKRTIFGRIPPKNDYSVVQKSKPSRIQFSEAPNLNIKEENYPEQTEPEDDDEEADYVNLPKTKDKQSSIPFEQNGVESVPLTPSASGCSINISLKSNVSDSGYSHVTVRPSNLPQASDNTHLNLSTSLEELSKEINEKTVCIASNTNSQSSGYSKVSDIVKNISKHSPVPTKNVNGLKNNFKTINQEEYKNEKHKLQYCGSFKTKHEREKWARNYVLLTSMKEEELEGMCSKNLEKRSVDELSYKKCDENDETRSEKMKISKSEENVVGNETSVNKYNSDADVVKICDKVSNYEEKFKNILIKTNSESRLSSLKHLNDHNYGIIRFKSSAEELRHFPAQTIDSTRSSISDKGSTDSLLDVDTQMTAQDGSLCTTASDSLLHTSETSDEEFSRVVQQTVHTSGATEDCMKKKPILSRNARIESCRLRFPIRGLSPPAPEPDQVPKRELFGGWSEYTFTDGRTFFYNSQTGERSWKPPRRRGSSEGKKKTENATVVYSNNSSPLVEVDEAEAHTSIESGSRDVVITSDTYHRRLEDNKGRELSTPSPVPPGWKLHVDPTTGSRCYVNLQTGAKWFSSNDDDGRVYYFEENSNESSWTLPSTNFSSSEKLEDNIDSQEEIDRSSPIYSNLPPIVKSSTLGTVPTVINESNFTGENSQSRSAKIKSLIILDPQRSEDTQSSFVSKNWPQLWDGHMCVLKEGTLNRTKITENGKRLRKNWASSHVVLTELFLLFFKDAKAFAAMKTGTGRPEMCVDLNGALIDRGDKVSSRKNVYIISTVLGLQVLIQNDCTQQADLWLLAIQGAIKNLPSGFDSCPRLTRGIIEPENLTEDSDSKKFYKVTRTKSVKTAKNKDGSIEDLTVSLAERQTKIKARLKKFFHRRPTMESLVKKGIWKDEPAFGCYLEQVCPAESPRVPLFVQRCIACIEKSEENMKTDGLYRASGNLSQVQKIRLQVDQNNLNVIEEEEDVHVLTGALKLFFRELKEPLIPYHSFHKSIKASSNHNRKEKIACFRDITKSLPPSNYDTLKFLLQHLLRVTKYKEYNRMHIPNLAIVFGPTLMWPEQESMNMALDLMQQNLVIECFLLEFNNIFR